MALRKNYYHCEIFFQKSSYFISYSSDTQALITATLARYFSHLNFINRSENTDNLILHSNMNLAKVQLIITEFSQQLCPTSHISVYLYGNQQSTRSICHPQTTDRRYFTVTRTEFSWKVLNSPGQISVKFQTRNSDAKQHHFFFFLYMWSLIVFIPLQISLKAFSVPFFLTWSCQAEFSGRSLLNTSNNMSK